MEATRQSGQAQTQSATSGKTVRKLGRGLSSLLNVGGPVQVASNETLQVPANNGFTQNKPMAVTPSASTDQSMQAATSAVGRVEPSPSAAAQSEVSVASIVPSPFQPRKRMDDAALAQLAASLKQSGVIQPVVVRQITGGQYELVAGERRWRAAQLAGLQSIPAVVRRLTDEQAAEWALVENVQREDLNPMERAWALRALAERFSLTQQQLAERVGLERSSVANQVRLTELEPEITAMIESGALSPGHGKALLQVQAGERRMRLATDCVEKGWNVRKLEQMTREAAAAAPARKAKSSDASVARFAVLRDIEHQIALNLGTKVTIRTDRAGKRGTLSIEFYGLDHFDGLMSRLGITQS